MEKHTSITRVFLFAFALILASCSSTSPSNATFVDVKQIQATIEAPTLNPVLSAGKRLSATITENESSNVVLYNDESYLTLTIVLDNPKAESIDAVEISSNDPQSQIMVDGSYNNIQVSGTTRILNWAQEDPYEKIFFVQVFQLDRPIEIKVTDLKVNGTWQGRPLSNASLFIHKLSTSVFSFEFIHNTFNDYRFRLNQNESIDNLVVNGATLNEDGTYSVRTDGQISWEFDYLFEGQRIQRTQTKEIELLKVVETYNWYQILLDSVRLMPGEDEAPIKSFLRTFYVDWITRFWIKIVGGTDVNQDAFEVRFDGGEPLLFEQGKNETPGFDYMPGLDPSFTFNTASLFIGGYEYIYTEQELKMPMDLEPGDNSNFDLA